MRTAKVVVDKDHGHQGVGCCDPYENLRRVSIMTLMISKPTQLTPVRLNRYFAMVSYLRQSGTVGPTSILRVVYARGTVPGISFTRRIVLRGTGELLARHMVDGRKAVLVSMVLRVVVLCGFVPFVTAIGGDGLRKGFDLGNFLVG